MSPQPLLGALSEAHDALVPVRAIDGHLARLGFGLEPTRLDLWDGAEWGWGRVDPGRGHHLADCIGCNRCSARRL
jgi:hypothetical protein